MDNCENLNKDIKIITCKIKVTMISLGKKQTKSQNSSEILAK